MRTIVCVKQVPASNEVRLDPKTNTIIRDGAQAVINPFDSHALEAALQLKERFGGTVTVLSMGIPDTQRMLRECVARGADRALLLTDRAFAGADTLATSYALYCGVKAAEAFDLVLCGKMAVDGDTAQIGPELAERLGVPHVTDVEWLEADADGEAVTVRRQLGGSVQTLRVPLPAVLTVTREVNVPRLPSIAGVLHAEETEVALFDVRRAAADEALCGLKGSPTQVVRTYLPQSTRAVEEVGGTPLQQRMRLVEIIKGEVNYGAGH